MKTKLLFASVLLTACAFSQMVNAQLEVQTSGDVKLTKSLTIGTTPDDYVSLNVYRIGPTDQTPTYGIKSFVKTPACPVYTLYGIYGVASSMNASALYYPYPIFGVYGEARKNQSHQTLAAGIAGLANSNGGVGVFGTINFFPTAPIPANAKYAGYFNGTTKINGTLLVNTIVLDGDTVILENIHALSKGSSHAIDLLRPISYSFKQDEALQYDEKAQQEMSGTHYGFAAQDVQKVLPEIVYERDGKMSINYIELIPLLIQRVQELSAEVEELKKQNK